MSQAGNHRAKIRGHLLGSAEVKRKASEECIDAIAAAVELIVAAFRSGGKLLICGNGGSAADSQHVASELVGRLTKNFERPGLPAIALTTDTSFLTAHANDCGYEGVFERQVQALGRPGDVLLAISTSGSSTNVIRAVEAALRAKMKAIALTGQGGRLGRLADVEIAVPSSDTQHIQEAHLAIEHIVCETVELSMFRGNAQGERPGR